MKGLNQPDTNPSTTPVITDKIVTDPVPDHALILDLLILAPVPIMIITTITIITIILSLLAHLPAPNPTAKDRTFHTPMLQQAPLTINH